MKKIVLSLFVVFMLSSVAFSQKYAFVDMNYILSEIPAYKDAQKELDDLSEKWQKEIEAEYKEIEARYKAYQQEQILLQRILNVKDNKKFLRRKKQQKNYKKNVLVLMEACFKKGKN